MFINKKIIKLWYIYRMIYLLCNSLYINMERFRECIIIYYFLYGDIDICICIEEGIKSIRFF